MSRVAEAALSGLRMKYRAAHAAYQSCTRAVAEATLSGSPVPDGLLEQEARALGELNKVRADLLAALSDASIAERPPGGDEPPP